MLVGPPGNCPECLLRVTDNLKSNGIRLLEHYIKYSVHEWNLK